MNSFPGTNVKIKKACVVIRLLEHGKEVEDCGEIRKVLIPNANHIHKVDSKDVIAANKALEDINNVKTPIGIGTLCILEKMGLSLELEIKEA